jgi:hypothetical protein
MIYGDPALAPKRPDTRGILAEARNAPSLFRHVEATAAVNSIYAGLRDAAWAQLKLIEGALPDERTMSNLSVPACYRRPAGTSLSMRRLHSC